MKILTQINVSVAELKSELEKVLEVQPDAILKIDFCKKNNRYFNDIILNDLFWKAYYTNSNGELLKLELEK